MARPHFQLHLTCWSTILTMPVMGDYDALNIPLGGVPADGPLAVYMLQILRLDSHSQFVLNRLASCSLVSRFLSSRFKSQGPRLLCTSSSYCTNTLELSLSPTSKLPSVLPRYSSLFQPSSWRIFDGVGSQLELVLGASVTFALPCEFVAYSHGAVTDLSHRTIASLLCKWSA